MQIHCGMDIIEIERVKTALERGKGSFGRHVFTEKEIQYCEGRKAMRYHSYAARFAAKEAVVKAFGTGIGKDAGWQDIEVLNDEAGRPYVNLTGRARNFWDQLGGIQLSISLSHCTAYAAAYVVMQTALQLPTQVEAGDEK